MKRSMAATPRPLADYRDIFLLDDVDLLHGTVLDCASGASPFGAQVRALGGKATSVDPVYEAAPDELEGIVYGDLAQVARWTREHPEGFDWTVLGTPAMFERYFRLAAELFLHDYQQDRSPYIAAYLPALPFPDDHFDLALCSHYLFSSADHLTFEENLAALRELGRVTAGEVRVYPLVGLEGHRYPRLEEIRAVLRDEGVGTEIRPSRFRFVKGAEEMLVLRPRSTG